MDQLVVYGIREHSRDCGANQSDGVFGISGLSLGRDQSFEMPPPYLAKLDGSKRLSLDSEGKHVALQELLVASERLGFEAVAVCIEIMIDVACKWHLGPESRLRVGSLAALLQLTIKPLEDFLPRAPMNKFSAATPVRDSHTVIAASFPVTDAVLSLSSHRLGPLS